MRLVLDFGGFTLFCADVAQSVCQDAVPLTSGSGAHTGVPTRTANPAELGTSPVYLEAVIGAREGGPGKGERRTSRAGKAYRESQKGGPGKGPGRRALRGGVRGPGERRRRRTK